MRAATEGFRNSLAQYYEPLVVPCPAEGEGALYQLVFAHALKDGEDIGTQVSFSARHEGDDPIDGIVVKTSDKLFCGTALEEPDPESFFNSEPSNGLCSEGLNTPEHNCYGISMLQGDDPNQGMVFMLFNRGGCIGNVTLEASIQDNNEDVATTSKCLKPIEDACGDGATSSGGIVLSGASAMLSMLGFY